MHHTEPATHAKVVASERPEYRPPEFPLERDVVTGNQITPRLAPLPRVPPKPRVQYTPAPGVTLDPVNDQMSITCVASPDAGWLVLSKFFAGVQNSLTVGMYDFTSAHVLTAVKTVFANNNRKLSLVLDDPPKNPTADQTDEETERELAQALGGRQEFAWAAEARDPMVTEGIFPNAYHIKVAVKDHDTFWLSSGNWNNSNEPDIDPWSDRAKADQVAAKSDRDWHVIVRHPGLARTFEAYLKHDLEVATQLQVAKQQRQGLALPAEAIAPEPRILAGAAPREYFKPYDIADATVKIQPLLTPDSGAGNYSAAILQLIKSATQKLYIQTQYVHPPPGGQDADFRALVDAVKAKMDAGLDVRVILSQYEASGGYLEKLQEAGWNMSAVRIQNGVHNKGFVVDSKIVAVGSQNWSGDGVLRNRDATVIIHHEGVAKYFEGIFLHDWDNLARQRVQTQFAGR
jgi:hypothetical protein